ncbi:hypothetical protein N7466_001379 [Penicillium verhagenii]|uniref:uncharacterized protein n=1 Tax=Penicillium verhagenii TaxID=1562060 RepID=UPI002545004A|nr:uncharacterized protein N7466_001379 [Penicillium verhagenii]KAJ5948364.1 hypothetical protein N7466_001379 [Penicillium verhagenii]
MDSSPPNSARGPLAGGKQITRNRVSLSCHVHPICDNCAKTGAECVYDVSSQRRDEGRDGAGQGSRHGVKRRRETPQTWEEDVDELQTIYGQMRQAEASAGQKSDPRAIEYRLDKLMSMIARLGGTAQALEAAERHAAAPSAAVESALLEELRQTHARNGRATSSRPSSPRRTAAESSGDEFPIPSGQATDLVDPVGSLNLGHLSLDDGGRSRYVGTTYWAYISHEINDLNQLLRDQNRSHDLSPSANPNEEHTDIMDDGRSEWKKSFGSPIYSIASEARRSFQPSVLFPSGESPTGTERLVEPEMLKHVPTRRQSQILYKGFMSGVHAISPVIHPPTVLKLYNAFWNWYDYSSYSGESCPSPSFIPLLYAIWYGGSVTISIRTIKAEFNAASRFSLSSMYNEEVTHWLAKISFPRSPSLQGLSAYLIVQTILSKEEEPLTSSLFVSLAMRVAQTMGLHRDPAKFGIESCEAEYRRRLWWHIMHMDGVVAMSSGLPPLVSDENYWDVRETSELKDTMLGSPEAERYEQLVAAQQRLPENPDEPSVCGGPSMVNVFYLTARGKYTMARAVRRILRIQLGTKPVTRRDMEELRAILLDLQLKLNSIIKRIPEDKSEQTPGSAGRALSMSKSPAFCVAYQPFLKNARSRIWPAARQSALRHCHGFMEKFIQLATDPDFQPFHWSWPGNHQPMHATMIMLIDLYERPYSPEASRSRAFIDRILALSGPDGGVVGGEDGISTQRPLKDGGREAWDMIRRLRQKAWQKAGLNPKMLWTEQDQIHAGIASPAGEPHNSRSPYHLGTSPAPVSPAASTGYQAVGSGRPLNDFNRMFYNMTRSQILPNPTSSSGAVRPSPLRYSAHPPRQASHPSSIPLHNTTPAAINMPSPATLTSPSAMSSSPGATSSLGTPQSIHSSTASQPQVPAALQPLPGTTHSSNMSFMDPISPNPPPLGVPTPPSMVDPNLNFDWDQWDAVFGQHLPVADELMELDPVSGLEFANFGIPPADGGINANGMSTETFPTAWADNPSGNSVSSSEWTGYR